MFFYICILSLKFRGLKCQAWGASLTVKMRESVNIDHNSPTSNFAVFIKKKVYTNEVHVHISIVYVHISTRKYTNKYTMEYTRKYTRKYTYAVADLHPRRAFWREAPKNLWAPPVSKMLPFQIRMLSLTYLYLVTVWYSFVLQKGSYSGQSLCCYQDQSAGIYQELPVQLL